MTEDIHVCVIDLKSSIPACVARNEDGSYTIFINDRTSAETRTEHYLHELDHILKDDFYKEDVDLVESERHREGR